MKRLAAIAVKKLGLRKPKFHGDSEDAPRKWKDRLMPLIFAVGFIGLLIALAKVPWLQLDPAPVKSAALSPQPAVWLDDPAKREWRGGIGRR